MQHFPRTLLGFAAAGLVAASLAAPAAACEWQRSVSASAEQAVPAAPQVVAGNAKAAAPAPSCATVTTTRMVDGRMVTQTTARAANCSPVTTAAAVE